MSRPDPLAARLPRRRVLATVGALLGAGAVGGTALAAYAAKVEPRRLSVSHRQVAIPRLPASLDGLSIAHLSDLHAGQYVSRGHIANAVRIAAKLNPDLVVLTGDFIYRDPTRIEECAEELSALQARFGVLAVLGNHDIWTDPAGIAARLKSVGVIVLRDRTMALEAGGGKLWLVGLDDRGYSGYRGGSADRFRYRWSGAALALSRMLPSIPDGEGRLLLVHNPDFTEMLTPGQVDLALCGHTHGGQVRLPLLGAPVVPSLYGQRFAEGLVQGSNTLVHVTRGVGLTPPAVRFNCPPEVSLLRLTRG